MTNGNGCGFKEHEIVRVQGRDFPIIGGGLRIVHESHKDKLSIETAIVEYVLDSYAIDMQGVVIEHSGSGSSPGPRFFFPRGRATGSSRARARPGRSWSGSRTLRPRASPGPARRPRPSRAR